MGADGMEVPKSAALQPLKSHLEEIAEAKYCTHLQQGKPGNYVPVPVKTMKQPSHPGV